MELPAKSGPFLPMRCHAIPCQSPLPSHPASLPIPSHPPTIPIHPIAPVPLHPAHPVPSHGRQSVASAVEGHKREKEATPARGIRRCRVGFLWQPPTPSLFPKAFLPLGRVHILLPLHSVPKVQPRGAWPIFLPPARLMMSSLSPGPATPGPGSMSMYRSVRRSASQLRQLLCVFRAHTGRFPHFTQQAVVFDCQPGARAVRGSWVSAQPLPLTPLAEEEEEKEE